MPIVPNSDGSFYIAGVDQRNSGDCAAVIQAAIDEVYSKYGGGPLWLPRNGNYKCGSGLTLRGGVNLVGHGKDQCMLNFQGVDVDAITLDSTCKYAGARDLSIQGYQGASPTKSTVLVAAGVPAIFQRCLIWGGLTALNVNGVDSTFEDCFINPKEGVANSAGVLSGGANWYKRCKIDTAGGGSVTDAFRQTARAAGLTGVMENHFEQCDFSGPFTRSRNINDGGENSAITIFDGCVISSPIVISNHRASIFMGNEFGSTSFSTPGNTSLVGNYAFSAMTVANASKAGNINIS